MITLKNRVQFVIAGAVVFSGVCAFGVDEPGLKFNNLTVLPYVNVEYIYDSNVESEKNAKSDSILRVNPGVDFLYKGNDWGIKGGGSLSDDRYQKYNALDALRYSESLGIYKESDKGWRFDINQRYDKSTQNDTRTFGEARLRDRDTFDLTSALAYEISDKTAVTLSGAYTETTFDNDIKKYGSPVYGYNRSSLGLELARKLTAKSNILLNGEYFEFKSDGATGTVSDRSTGYSLMAGFGSRATEKIRYKIVTGLTEYEYADKKLTAWTYKGNMSWVVNKKVALTIAGASEFQPGSSRANEADQTYSLSTGVTYRPVKKLSATADIMGRRDEPKYGAVKTIDDTISLGARINYALMRYVSLYVGMEYRQKMSEDSALDYDQYRGTVGMNFKY